MKRPFISIIPAALIGLTLLLGTAGCSRGWAVIDVHGSDGYNHRGYYDDHRVWHGGWYDHDRHYHEDPHDWRR